MGSWEKMPKPGTSHACPRCDSGCLAVRCLWCKLGGRTRWHSNRGGIGVHPGLKDSTCWRSLPAEQLVYGPHGWWAQSPRWVASPAACGRQDDCPLPHPRCRHFCFQTHARVGFLRVARLLPLTRCTGLGWDGASAFALSNANGCWWVSGRELSCPPAYDGQRHPLHIPSMHVTSCGTKLRIYPYPTITNAASVVLWPKALDDHLYPVAALYLA